MSEYRTWEKGRIDVWAADMRFTLDQITRLNAAVNPKAPFAGRIDINRVGLFGHSFGGMAAARACALDQRFKACLNQDGSGADGSIPHYNEGQMPSQPFMFLRQQPPHPQSPSEQLLAELHMTREQFEQDIAKRKAQMEKELLDCTGGAFQVWVKTPGFEHMSFADFSLLQAAGNPDQTSKALKGLRVIEAYTKAFFDKYLNGLRDTLLDRELENDEVAIKRYHN